MNIYIEKMPTKFKLDELRRRANERKNDPNLRHIPNIYDIKEENTNAILMQKIQNKTIK